MPASIEEILPKIPLDRWNAEQLGVEGDVDERTLKSFYAIDADTGLEAELRVLAWILGSYENDLRWAKATADEAPLRPGRWRVTVEWDTRGE
ncbi:hypothetical protein GCM10022226_61660 [Sphaerisporangium flaviroseum]|uniref:Uncharacterized protein n=1 Tax=Sphaerisporangium flaviroseum TaxID=509199 RepID=A0ABP7J170_9ACTN